MTITSRKKILFIYYRLFKAGGVTKSLVNIANELSRFHDVSILVLIDDKSSFYKLDPKIKVISINTFDHWAFRIGCNFLNKKYLKNLPYRNSIKAYLYDYGSFRTINQWMSQNDVYDNYITCLFKLSSYLSINKNVRKKLITWEHNSHDFPNRFWKIFPHFFYKKINRIITINTESEKYFKNFNPNTQTIYNIIGEPFENCSVDFEAKENIITYVGRLSKEKNIDHIIDIYNSSKLVNNFKLHIIGEGELREFLQKKAHNPNIIFRGIMSSDEICQHLTKSKIIILTSQTEGLPTVLIEAMFCGNILLSYNCNYGPKEIVNNKNGFLIDVGDKTAAIMILNKLNDDLDLQTNLMKSSFLESKKWKKEVIIDKWLNIFS